MQEKVRAEDCQALVRPTKNMMSAVTVGCREGEPLKMGELSDGGRQSAGLRDTYDDGDAGKDDTVFDEHASHGRLGVAPQHDQSGRDERNDEDVHERGDGERYRRCGTISSATVLSSVPFHQRN